MTKPTPVVLQSIWWALALWALVALITTGCGRYERHTRELYWPGDAGEPDVVTVEMPRGAEIEDVRMYERDGTVYVVAPVE